jgi:hypothetical protein
MKQWTIMGRTGLGLLRSFVFIFGFSFAADAASARKAKKELADPSTVKLEAKVPEDHQESPMMLNLLMVEAREDIDEVPNEGTIVYLKGQFEMKKHKFKNLLPRVKISDFYKVSLKAEAQRNLPLDLAGLGPFYLAKISKEYYLLTPKNFETIFGDLRDEEEALNYLAEYENLFVSPVVCVVTSETEKGLQKAKRPPPRLSTVTRSGVDFKAQLIVYSIIQVDGFFEKEVKVTREGAVTADEEPRLIQKISDGVSY